MSVWQPAGGHMYRGHGNGCVVVEEAKVASAHDDADEQD